MVCQNLEVRGEVREPVNILNKVVILVNYN